MEVLNPGYTFDDVLLVPQHSSLESRQDANTSTFICGTEYEIPIISANMDSCTELRMAEAMQDAGGLGILHRFMSLEKQVEQVNQFYAGALAAPRQDSKTKDFTWGNIGVSIGVNGGSIKALHTWLQTPEAEYELERLPTLIVIDIAHGDSAQVYEMVEKYWELVRLHGLGEEERPKLMAGNVATGTAARMLIDAGVDAIKVGVGPGSMCTTRIVTGCGVPQLTAIDEVIAARNEAVEYASTYEKKERMKNITIIADGGIKNSGDIVKALAAGADAVMVGGLLAGTNATPGSVITSGGEQFKVYRGMASKDAQLNREGKPVDGSKIVPEGEGKLVPFKGDVSNVLHQLVGGIKSGMSYCGAFSLQQLRDNAVFIPITGNGMAESRPHGV